MRTSFRFLLAAATLAAAIPASAQVPEAGIVATEGCLGFVDNDVENAEFIGIKVPTGGACTDMLFDFTQTGGQRAGGAQTGDSINIQWNLPPNWTNAQVASDVTFAVIVYPPAPGTRANRIFVDSGTINNQDFSAATRQTIGNSIPSTYTGTQGIDLALSSAGSYGVKLRGPGGATTAGFPRGANGGVEVAFSPVAEVNPVDLIGGGCTVSGESHNPSNPADPAVDGVILGYNVYRVSGAAGSPPTAQNFYDASIDALPDTGWQYFMPLTQSFNLGAPDTNPGSSTPPAPSDMNPNDLGGLQNPDGTMFSGDEVMIFQDSATNRGTARTTGTAPVTGSGYWYAFQPVLCGQVSDMASGTFGFGPGNSIFPGDHVSSSSPLSANDDSVDLDLDGNIEFFSPQADFGLPGLGLTYNGLPALSEPVFGSVNPAPARGTVVLSGDVHGQTVNLTFQTSLEMGDVQGFNVYRGVGDARVRVNTQMILSQGSESSVYQLVDDAVQARRLAKAGAIQYTVDVVYADGHTSTVGPFSVTLERQAPGRRSR